MGAYNHNLIPNGNLELWDAGPVPTDMDAQVTNTVITILDEVVDGLDHPARSAWADITVAGTSSGDKYVSEGHHALRATLAAGAAVDNFRLHPEGVNALAWTGASTEQITVDGLFHRYRLHFAARCSVDANVLLGRVVLRSAADAVELHKDDDPGWGAIGVPDHNVDTLWMGADAATRPTWALTTRWRRYGTTFVVPPADGAAPVGIENLVWQLSNGTAGAQIIDLDDIWIEDLEQSFSAR
jgi:hypothetical protein